MWAVHVGCIATATAAQGAQSPLHAVWPLSQACTAAGARSAKAHIRGQQAQHSTPQVVEVSGGQHRHIRQRSRAGSLRAQGGERGGGKLLALAAH